MNIKSIGIMQEGWFQEKSKVGYNLSPGKIGKRDNFSKKIK